MFTFDIESAQMADDPKIFDASKDRQRAPSGSSWWLEILLGVGIGILLGSVVIAAIFLDRMRLIPTWVFGWISSDRATQKYQFRLAICGLITLWVTMQLLKLGLFGEITETIYNAVFMKLRITQNKSNDEIHARVCAIKNPRVAAFLVGFFTLESFMSWRELGKPFAQNSLYDLLIQIVLCSVVLFPLLFKISRCLPERLILGIVLIEIVTGWVIEYSPDTFEGVAGLVRQFNLILHIFALLAGLGLLVSSSYSRKSTSYS